MLQPKRKFNAGEYRFGFNGKENDNEIKGIGNQQNYGLRIYDPRLGKFLSVDPLLNDFPWNSTYAFAENNVISNVDLDGAERHPYTYLPQWIQNSIHIFNGSKEGLKQLAHDYAPIRPADENDKPTTWEDIKNIPHDIVSIPSNLMNVYENGSMEEKAQATIGILGIVGSLKSGRVNSSPTMLKVVEAGYNKRTRIVTFIQGTAKKIRLEIKVPDGFDLVKVDGSKAEVFKETGKKV